MDKTLFDAVIDNTKEQLSTMHAGRVTPALIENVMVEAYDSQMRLQEVASITSPEPQMLMVDAWDKSLTKNIEAGLRTAGEDYNPVVDGEIIRISFPPLTEEKRVQLTKKMHEMIEQGRIGIRKVREDVLKDLKAQEKNGDISEDDYYRQEKEVQETVDSYNNQLKELSEKKEEELMRV